MISVPLLFRMLFLNCLLIGLLASNPASAQPVPVNQAPAQVQPMSVQTDVIAPKRARATGKWSIRVHGWSKSFKRGDQGRIDRCRATLWWGSLPRVNAKRPTWLAGHNYCGFWRWDDWLPVGAHFSIKGPQGKVHRYKVYRRAYVNRKSGSSQGLIHNDITLQTCRGKGMTFVYAQLTR